jgi:4,5-dihydroxyphthalate decarboxylase
MTIELSCAIGDYPHVKPLKSGAVVSSLLKLDFAAITPINRAFAPMVRDLKFDVSEMAIGTFIQAKAYGKKLALLPVVTLARFQEAAMLCRADSAIRGPADLKGRRVGVRAYSQTTGLWLRGTLSDDFGVAPESIDWIIFEEAHVAEYRDPSFVRRAAPGEALLTLLRHGAIDAAIFGADAPNDPQFRCVFPDPQVTAKTFLAHHGFTPINHMVCVKQALAEERPELVEELLRMFRAAAESAGDNDPTRFSREAIDPALELAARYASEQGLTDRRLDLTEIWLGATKDRA